MKIKMYAPNGRGEIEVLPVAVETMKSRGWTVDAPPAPRKEPKQQKD